MDELYNDLYDLYMNEIIDKESYENLYDQLQNINSYKQFNNFKNELKRFISMSGDITYNHDKLKSLERRFTIDYHMPKNIKIDIGGITLVFKLPKIKEYTHFKELSSRYLPEQFFNSEWVGQTEIKNPDWKKIGATTNVNNLDVKYTKFHKQYRAIVKGNKNNGFQSYILTGREHPIESIDGEYYSCGFCKPQLTSNSNINVEKSFKIWESSVKNCFIEFKNRIEGRNANKHQAWGRANSVIDCCLRMFFLQIIDEMGEIDEIDINGVIMQFLFRSREFAYFHKKSTKKQYANGTFYPDPAIKDSKLVFYIINNSKQTKIRKQSF